MNDFFTGLKALFATVCSWISLKLGVFAPLFLLLFFAMTCDYITGMICSGQKGQLNSKRGFQGILKKLSYLFVIGVSLTVDCLICFMGKEYGVLEQFYAFFGGLTAIWLILNELLSILENLGSMGVPLPKFLTKAVEVLKQAVSEKGDQNNEK